MSLIVFEDSLVENFYPLTLTRAAFELLYGTKTLLENITQSYDDVSIYSREYLKGVLKHRIKYRINEFESDLDVLLVNALINSNSNRARKLLSRKGRFVALYGRNVVAARLPSRHLAKKSMAYPFAELAKVKEFDVLHANEAILYRYPWELVDDNAKAIAKQAKGRSTKFEQGIFVKGPRNRAIISPKAGLEPPVAIDTRNGAVVIDDGAQIDAMSRLEGPCYIGKNSKIRSALIGEGTSVGNSCVIGGEVEHSIIMGYSNKAHLGYLGHSIIGSWVNLGAQTTNSNLKNTYGEIKVHVDKITNTKRVKVGCYIADNAKTAIGSLILAGKKVGMASHAYGFVPEDIPSFTIYAKGIAKQNFELELDSAIETQRRMMARRGVKQSVDDIKLLKLIFKMTEKDRQAMGVIRGKFKI